MVAVLFRQRWVLRQHLQDFDQVAFERVPMLTFRPSTTWNTSCLCGPPEGALLGLTAVGDGLALALCRAYTAQKYPSKNTRWISYPFITLFGPG